MPNNNTINNNKNENIEEIKNKGGVDLPLSYDQSVKKDNKGNPILGRLTGPCADIIHATRNGRKYSEQLWENVFNSDIAKETFECGGYLGELDHPADRLETCTEKVAVCMPEPPKKNKDGLLVGSWDILDTPNGRILKTLCDYGYKIGISSRGDGDVDMDYDGNESVNPDTYDFQGFDVVLLPAVKAARLNYISESFNGGKSLNQALTESLNKATEDDKRIMTETLSHLNIDGYKQSDNSGVNIDEGKKTDVANNIGTNVIKDLQESLLKNQKLEKTVAELQEKLSVSYTKEAKIEEELEKYKRTTIQLSNQAKTNKTLKEDLQKGNSTIKKKDLLIESQTKTIDRLMSKQKVANTNCSHLREALTQKESVINNLNKRIKNLNEQLQSDRQTADSEKQSLVEKFDEVKKNLSIKTSEFNTKIAHSNKLVEHYRKVAQTATDKYITSRANMLGVNANEIKNKLNENYSFNDIDSICQELEEYQMNVSALPFNLTRGAKKVSVKESIEPIKPKGLYDDTVDDDLISLVNHLQIK